MNAAPWWITPVSTLLGAAIALLGSIATTYLTSRAASWRQLRELERNHRIEREKALHEKRFTTYVELTGILGEIERTVHDLRPRPEVEHPSHEPLDCAQLHEKHCGLISYDSLMRVISGSDVHRHFVLFAQISSRCLETALTSLDSYERQEQESTHALMKERHAFEAAARRELGAEDTPADALGAQLDQAPRR